VWVLDFTQSRRNCNRWDGVWEFALMLFGLWLDTLLSTTTLYDERCLLVLHWVCRTCYVFGHWHRCTIGIILVYTQEVYD